MEFKFAVTKEEFSLIKEALCAKVARGLAEARDWEIYNAGRYDMFETVPILLIRADRTFDLIKKNDEQRASGAYDGLELDGDELLSIRHALEQEQVHLVTIQLDEEGCEHYTLAETYKIRKEDSRALCDRITETYRNKRLQRQNDSKSEVTKMRWQDFKAAEDGMLKIWSVDGWTIWAESAEEALDKAPAGYGIALAIGKDDDEHGIQGQMYAVFKTTADRDLYKSGCDDTPDDGEGK